MQRRTCHFSGRVQGVGFRYTVNHSAMRYDLRGYVKNLADGRVELVMEGDEKEMDRLVEEIKRQMSGFIKDVKCETSPPTGEFQDFSVRHR
jgi:acylphosphatase